MNGSLPPDTQNENAATAEPAAAETAMPGAEEKKPEPAWKKTLKFLFKFGVSAGILTYIVCTRDIKWQDFKLVKPWCIVAAFFAIYTQLSLTGVRWFTLLRAAGVKCSFIEAFSLQMQGMFFSQFLPGGSVGDVEEELEELHLVQQVAEEDENHHAQQPAADGAHHQQAVALAVRELRDRVAADQARPEQGDQ